MRNECWVTPQLDNTLKKSIFQDLYPPIYILVGKSTTTNFSIAHERATFIYYRGIVIQIEFILGALPRANCHSADWCCQRRRWRSRRWWRRRRSRGGPTRIQGGSITPPYSWVEQQRRLLLYRALPLIYFYLFSVLNQSLLSLSFDKNYRFYITVKLVLSLHPGLVCYALNSQLKFQQIWNRKRRSI